MSRKKGNVAEREVAALMQFWWRHLEPGTQFVRTPLSGGWGGPAVRAGFRASGDLMTTAARFPFAVEVKRREAFDMGNVLKGRPSPVWGWWLQAQGQAEEMSCEPMLWFRKSRDPWRVLLRAEFIVGLTLCWARTSHRWNRWPTRVRGVRPVCVLGAALLSEHPILFAELAEGIR